VLSIFLVLIVLLSAVYVQPATASEFQKQWIEARRHRLHGEIGIFYDPFDVVISQIAQNVSTALDMANVSSSLHEVSSVFELEHALNESGAWIAIYLFNSGLENVTMGHEVVDWEDFAQFLLRYKRVHHILGIGNTRKLAEYIGEDSKNVHLADTDLIDAKLTFLYSLWAVAEVLESIKGSKYKEAGLDIRRVGLKFFADNFNDLFERTLEPKVPLGEEDLVQKQKDFEKLKERFPKTVQELPPIQPSGITPDVRVKTGSNDADFLSADASSVPPPRLYLTRMPGTSTTVSEPTYAGSVIAKSGSAVEQLFKVLDIPMKSGVDGPIGSVLDFLLEVLIKVGGYTSAALGEETVEKIIQAVSAIKTIIGLAEDFEGRSALKGLFELIKLEFPALGKYEKFFDLFVDALYAFRGDLQEIVNWVKDALVVLIDELELTTDTKEAIKGVLDEILSLGEEVYDIIESSENVFDDLLSWFVERIVPKIVDRFLSEVSARIPGLPFRDQLIMRAYGVEKIASILNAIVNFVVTSDSTALLDRLVFSVFDFFGFLEDLGWTAVSRIMALMKLVCAVLGYSEKKVPLKSFSSSFLRPPPRWITTGGWPLWTVDIFEQKLEKAGKISDVFAASRGNKFHRGVDIHAKKGTWVFSVGNGKVTSIDNDTVYVEEWNQFKIPTGHILGYGHLINIKVAEDEEVTEYTPLGKVGTAGDLDHIHFEEFDERGVLFNPLRFGGPLEYRDNPGKPTVPLDQIYPWKDDANPDSGEVDPSRTFVAGKIDIVARAYDPTDVVDLNDEPADAGVMQLKWRVENTRTGWLGREKYLIRDGLWDGPLDNRVVPHLFKEEQPADTDDTKQKYFYIITNTIGPDTGVAYFIDKEGCWNTKLIQGINEEWDGEDAMSNVEAQYPDGWYLIWIRAGSDMGKDQGVRADWGDWAYYSVNINNFEQTVATSDANGNLRDDFTASESIYINGEGYAKGPPYKVYVFPHRTWADGESLEELRLLSPDLPTISVTSDASGRIQGTIPGDGMFPGQYDIVVDYDDDGQYSIPRFGRSVDALHTFTVTGSAGATSQSHMIPDAQPASLMNPQPSLGESWFSSNVETQSVPTTSTNADNVETFEDAFGNFSKQVMFDIKEAVEQGKRDVDTFKRQIRDHLEYAVEQAGLTVSDSTKSAMVDAIVLVAGVLNPKFEKSELPTLLTVTRDILEGLEVPTDTIDTVDNVVTSIMAIAAIIKDDDDLKQVISGVVGQFDNQYASIGVLVENTVNLTLRIIGLNPDTIQEIQGYIETFTAVGQATFNIIKAWRENTIQGIIQTIIQGVGFALSQYYDVDLQVYAKILEIAFPEAMEVTVPPTPQEAVTIINDLLQDLGVDPDIIEVITTVAEYIAEIRDVFTDGYRWIFNKLMDWLSGKVEELADYLNRELSSILGRYSFFHLKGKFPLGLGKFTAFEIKYDLALDAGINLRTDELFTFVTNIIFDGYDIETGETEDVLKTILSFVEIVPLFKGSLELGGFGSNANPFMNTLLESLGVEMRFEGGGHFTIQLLSFKGGAFEPSGFMKVIEWGFRFTIEISRDFTLFDLLTGGVGAGALNKLAEYIGLDGIVITIMFSLTVEIIKRAASPTGPEQATFTLIIIIGAALTIGISIVIASIRFYGSLQIIFTFTQDLLGDTPLKIFMDLVAHVQVTITLLFSDINEEWGPKKLFHYDFTARDKTAAEGANETMGVDRDHDGLSDEYEKTVPGLRWDSEDTDEDGLTDKEELQTTKTDPINRDTDGDGLNDYDELYNYKTHPKRVDTDYDGLSDYEEVTVYGTKPTVMDTDEDGLDDYYEVNHVWDIPPNVTTSVKEVWIGGVAYNDHTDPLDPDTDDDGLLDGEEGAGGPYYGLSILYNETNEEANLEKLYPDSADSTPDDDPVIFNYGYTHPLDNDTDDDSYLQLWNGTKAMVNGEHVFLHSMTDGEEVKGIWVTFITEGEPNRTLVRTNPVNPDTDGDTGADRTKPIPDDRYLNSDGYELSLNPPTDPTNADSDHDGLIDGLEGFLNPYPESYHTNPTNPDTDGDGLGDMQEILLGTDPRNADTDFDLVLDGDEYHRFHTNPHQADSDYDGLEDYEELFFWHSNPNLRDSDADGISDGEEVLKHDTDPMDEDTDNDGLNDYDEIFKHGTDPFNPDTDGDGLRDYEEAKIYLTDPLNWDTDGDSIPYPNEYGEMTWSMSDGDEVFIHGTNPAGNDTDGDGLADNEEVTLAGVMVGYGTNATNPDTDGDLLPDGYEVDPDIMGNATQRHGIHLDPLNPDANNNGILDGYEIDLDNDGLSDGEEFFIYNTYEAWKKGSAFAGGFLNPDSDGDGLSDGVEVNEFGTDPTKYDTDGDGYSDGAEVAVGTDPLSFTSPEEYQEALDMLRAGKVIRIIYPTNTTISDTTADVRVVNSTFIETMWFRYNDGTGWSSNYTLQYDAANIQWKYTDINWPEGSYWIQVFGNKTAGYVVWDQQWFTIRIEEVEIPFFRGWSIKILSPANTTIYDKYVDVRVINATEVVNMWFRYDSGFGWLGNYTLQYNSATQEWENTTVLWSEGLHHLQVFAYTTSEEVIWDEQWFAIGAKIDWIEIVSPANTTILDVGVDVLVVNSTAVENMWFRYDSGEGWSNNYTLQYNSADQRWENTTIVWPEDSYHLQVFAATPRGDVLSDREWFTIYVEKPVEPPFQLYLLVLGVVIGGAGTSASFLLLQRRKRRTETRKGKDETKKEDEK
jgi:hypothetical protein